MTSKISVTNPKSPWPKIQVINRQRRFRLFPEAIARLCAEVIRVLGKPHSSASVVFIGTRKMRSLNREYLGRDYATDVLSFNYAGKGTDPHLEDAALYLGDIVISTDVAWNHASNHDVTLDQEVSKLLIHGILHLLGYDHERDDGEMNRLQARLLRRWDVQNPGPVANMK
ncbi:MAG TPA: rRNA maturation RNase YbeY [Acidobacteriota bacterium]|nr:rRNA maturation RNase YbeY [Acidobacteriota bacterium]